MLAASIHVQRCRASSLHRSLLQIPGDCQWKGLVGTPPDEKKWGKRSKTCAILFRRTAVNQNQCGGRIAIGCDLRGDLRTQGNAEKPNFAVGRTLALQKLSRAPDGGGPALQMPSIESFAGLRAVRFRYRV